MTFSYWSIRNKKMKVSKLMIKTSEHVIDHDCVKVSNRNILKG